MSPAPVGRRGLSREISRIADASVTEMLALSDAAVATGRRIGVTGPPGAGKSSLIARLVRQRLERAGDIAVIAVDPTSPVSGGAILGDRIRMEELATDPRVYIRSLASRHSLDGLADNLPSVLGYLETAGFTELVIETVGVGQVEYEIRSLVDTLVLVLIPGAGDQIQAMKGGILETADIIAVNKADLPGVKQLVAELRSVLERRPAAGWTVPVILTSSADPAGETALAEAIDRHRDWCAQTGRNKALLAQRKRHHVGSLIARRLHEVLPELPAAILDRPLAGLYDEVLRRLTV